MTHHEQRTPWGDALEALSENGFDGMAEAMRVLINEAMKIERSSFLGAELHERTDQRRGYANGFKPKRVRTRVGEIDVQVPQVRDVEGGASFYPSSLERGQRSERALTLALAEMYVQGVLHAPRRGDHEGALQRLGDQLGERVPGSCPAR